MPCSSIAVKFTSLLGAITGFALATGSLKLWGSSPSFYCRTTHGPQEPCSANVQPDRGLELEFIGPLAALLAAASYARNSQRPVLPALQRRLR